MVEKVILLSFLPHASVKYSWYSSGIGLGLMFRCIAICFVVEVVVVVFSLGGGWGSLEAAGRDAGIWAQPWWKRGAVNLQEQSSSFDPHSSFSTLKVLLVKICHCACGSSVLDVVGSVPPQRLGSHIKAGFYIICKVHLCDSTGIAAQLSLGQVALTRSKVCGNPRDFQSSAVAQGQRAAQSKDEPARGCRAPGGFGSRCPNPLATVSCHHPAVTDLGTPQGHRDMGREGFSTVSFSGVSFKLFCACFYCNESVWPIMTHQDFSDSFWSSCSFSAFPSYCCWFKCHDILNMTYYNKTVYKTICCIINAAIFFWVNVKWEQFTLQPILLPTY